MTVSRLIPMLLVSCGLLLVAGCGRGDGGIQIAEQDESLYQQGKQLLRQGREAEALGQFLKVIEIRGERAAPESHFEAGLIYLRQMKDPVSAIYHFRKYVDYPPANSKQVQSVRELINTARREFAATLPGTLLEGQSARMEAAAELEALRRENEDLRAELATLRGNAGAAQNRPNRLVFPPVDPAVRPAPAPANTTAPAQGGGGAVSFSPAPSPTPRASEEFFQPAPSNSGRGAASNPRANAATSGKTHTVKPGEGLWRIAKQYGVSPEAVARANGITDPTKIKEGTVLKIP